jgi:hypothetical protein
MDPLLVRAQRLHATSRRRGLPDSYSVRRRELKNRNILFTAFSLTMRFGMTYHAAIKATAGSCRALKSKNNAIQCDG